MLRGLPQRTAHHRVGALVALAKEKRVRLIDLSDADLQSVDPTLDATIREVLSVDGAINAYQSFGSSNPNQVASQVAYWKTVLKY
jgi:argininosuccinate lyase